MSKELDIKKKQAEIVQRDLLGLKETANDFAQIWDGFKSCLTGLWVSGKYIFKPTVTLHYPDQRWVMYKNTRNWLKLVMNEETGEELCTACGSCVRVCPCSCIRVAGKKAQKRKGLVPDIFEIDFSLCCFCGLCVEVCPFNAIKFCAAYEMSCYDRNELLWNKEALLNITDDFTPIKESKKVSTLYINKWENQIKEYKIPE
ncbi:MAG TPA: 4Fe-4S binding protein [Candidatus Eremiobacteraeota bacterium]|nr:MAG: NADH-quinone oxidoreductase subunit I [bacterium ADurb.Bin363]HPZ09077.1 4Fe-4S binding protein [Candidatus Eremiobacteraeota bacterium]